MQSRFCPITTGSTAPHWQEAIITHQSCHHNKHVWQALTSVAGIESGYVRASHRAPLHYEEVAEPGRSQLGEG